MSDPAANVSTPCWEQAARTPDAPAVRDARGAAWSYGELLARADAVAAETPAGALVPLTLPRDATAVAAILGTLAAGSAYLPLDPTWPEARRAELLRKANAPATPLCYALATSGSTGAPKLVAMPHGPLVNLLAWHARTLPLPSPGGRVAAVAPLAFDVHFQEIFSTLAAGGCVVMVDEETRRDPRALRRLLHAESVSRVFLPPVLLAAMTEADDLPAPGALREVICAGEALRVTPAIRRFFGQLAPGATLHNHYGPAETHVVTAHVLAGDPATWPNRPGIGTPIDGITAHLLDPDDLRPVPDGEPSELFLTGPCLADGYLHDPARTAERFPILADGTRAYRTGDLARRDPDGVLHFLGRVDDQIKVRGFRVEPGEVETALGAHPAVLGCAAFPLPDSALGAACVLRPGTPATDPAELRRWLGERLPAHAVPGRLDLVPVLPLSPNGKVDRRALAAAATAPTPTATNVPTAADRVNLLRDLWSAHLPGGQRPGPDDNVFDLGADSLTVLRVQSALAAAPGGADVPATEFFAHPTPAGLAATFGRTTSVSSPDFRAGIAGPDAVRDDTAESARQPQAKVVRPNAIAIVGLAARFPGAPDVETFWANLLAGTESITRFTDAELETPRVSPDAIPARGFLPDADLFDADFFNIPPREAALLDPQARVLLELAWTALEHAGHGDPARLPRTGVFVGASLPTYLLNNVLPAAGPDGAMELATSYQQTGRADFFGNERDFLATRIAYRLCLRGPALTVGAACATGLVAVAQAVNTLRSGDADMALAGAASITFPQRRAYATETGAMASPTGRCRAFDADADGTVFGDGAGMVVLRRLADAERDGDTVYAVLHGIALNNDGAGKASFSAPSAAGQAEVIQMAHARAGIDPAAIGYVEAHGTGTPMGDPIEVAGLTTAFRAGGVTANGTCALGSVKTNIGHVESAAGIAGLIKTTLALHHGVIPPTLHFRTGNGQIDWANGPFRVPTAPEPWPAGKPFAGVSAFGVGGTNAHAVLGTHSRPAGTHLRGVRHPAWTTHHADAPEVRPYLLPFSARTPAALDAAVTRLADILRAPDAPVLADVANTLGTGRRHFPCRRAIVASKVDGDLRAPLLREAPRISGDFVAPDGPRRSPSTFLFPGQGAQRPGMGAGLYAAFPAFRAELDRCAALFGDPGLLPAMFGADPAPLRDTRRAQGALFAFGWSLAHLWQSWGVTPAAMVGHSVGEWVAATLAGVFTLEDSLNLVALRARLVAALPPGAMLAVRLPEADLLPLLPDGVEIAAVNAPGLCVAAGPFDAIAELEQRLTAADTPARRLETSHAFHSAMVADAVAPFAAAVAAVPRRAPTVPIISTVTGQPLTDAEATDPAYWAGHLRRPVRFADAVATAAANADENTLFLEVAPAGAGLVSLVRQHPAAKARVAVASLAREVADEPTALLDAAGKLWTAGVALDWEAVNGPGRRVALPTYPFERRRFWVDAPTPAVGKPPLRGGALSQAPAPLPAIPSPVSLPMPTPVSRLPALAARVRTVLAALSGQGLGPEHDDATFLDLGLDSLLLTQAAGALRREFNVPLAFRQLLEELPGIAAVAGYLDGKLPPEPQPAVVVGQASLPGVVAAAVDAVPTATGTVAPQPPASTALEGVIQEQLRLMARQLELLGGSKVDGAVPRAVESSVASQNQQAASPQQTARGTAPATPTPFGPYRPPVVTRPAGDLSPEQRRGLDDLIARTLARTPGSKARTAQHRPHFADPRSVAGFRPLWKEMVYPIVAESSAGARIRDVDGNDWLDLTMGFGTNLLGHAPAFITDALRAQLDRGIEVGPQSAHAGEVARLLCDLTGHERAAFCNTGSEAVLAACRVARTVTGRARIALCTGDYHGVNDETLVRPGPDAAGLPIAPGVPEHIANPVLVVPYGTPEGLETLRRHAPDLAAVLLEPVQSRHPDLQPIEWVREARAITAAAGCALILDEVITGFRLHPGGAGVAWGIEPDLSTWGKIMGGGLPIGAVTGKAAWMDALDGGPWQYGDNSFPEAGVTFFAGTYVRHPLAMAGARAILSYLKEQGSALQETLSARMSAMVNELNADFRASGCGVHLETCASWFYPHFDDGLAARWGSLLFYALRARGIHLWEGRPCFLSTAHTGADVAAIQTAFRESVAELQAAGFLPGSAFPVNRDTPASGSYHPPRLDDLAASVADHHASGSHLRAGLNDPPTRADDHHVSGSYPPASADRTPGRGSSTLPGAKETPPSIPFAGPLCLTDAQRGLWMLGDADPTARRAYTESVTLALDGPLEPVRLRAALQAVADRHEALRTTFAADGESQTVHLRLPVELPVEDLTGRPLEAVAARLRQWEAEMVPDLVNGPVWCARLARLGERSHRLVLTFSHLLGNGPSYWAFFEELCDALHGNTFPADPPAQLSDFVRWRNTRDPEASARFWQERFAAPPAPLELPGDLPKPARPTHRGTRTVRTLDAAFTLELRRAAAAHKSTLFTFLFTGFQALLHRLAGTDDLAVGVPFEGDARETLPGGARLLANTTDVLPLRSQLGPDDRFADRLTVNRTLALDAAEHRDYFLGRLARDLKLPAEGGRTTLFRTVFNYEGGKFLREDVDGHGLRVEFLSENVPYRGPRDTAGFVLYLNIAEHDGTLRCELDGQTDTLRPATLRRWLGHYETLLRGAAADPTRAVRALPLLDDAGRQQVLVEWNRPGAADVAEPETTLHGLFVAQAARTPDAPAVIVDATGKTLTYAQLDRKSNKLARRLQTLGAGPGTLVGLCLPRGSEILVAMLATLKTGAAYVPLDPDLPPARLSYLIEDSAAPVVVVEGENSAGRDAPPGRPPSGVDDAPRGRPGGASLPAAVSLVDLARDWPDIAHEDASPLPPSPAAAAYVLYTSGSTGHPKGAIVPHRAVVSRLRWTERHFPLAADDRVLLKALFSFDASVWEVFWPLMTGAAIVVAKPGGQRDSAYLADCVSRHAVTTIQFVPSMLAAFVDEPDLETKGKTLRRALIGGEVLPPETAERWNTRLPAARLFNLYGPTETAVYATAWDCAKIERPLPIGFPVGGTRAYILGADGQPQPPGVPGDLFLGGPGVGLGYWQRPELTAERFVPDPFAADGTTMYRTGDVARWRPEDGAILFHGRSDDQVKVRGIRIELGEIESLLAEHPAVREAAVAAREDHGPGDKRLVAYVVRWNPETDTPALSPLAGELREHLRARLAEHSLPSAFVELPALPRLPNGKLDRRALPAPDWTAAVTETPTAPDTAAHTPLEDFLLPLWAETLGLPAGRVGVGDQFFELGGDSLLALRLVNRLRQRLGEPVSLIAIFEAPTVAQLAARLETEHPAAVRRLLGEEAPAPLSERFVDQDLSRVPEEPPVPAGRIMAVNREARRARRNGS